MLYSDLVNFISTVFQIPVTSAISATPFQDSAANTILPLIITFAETMINEDMDFIGNRTQNSTVTFTANNRQLTLPVGTRVIQGVAQISPAGAQPGDNGASSNDLEPVSLDVIDVFYPTPSAVTGPGSYWAPKDATTIVVAPTPDANYVANITGIFYPAPISSTNTTTYIGTFYPHLLMAATAYYMAGYQRDFGAQSEDPKLAQSWKATYDYLLPTCIMEEKRRKGESIQTSRSSSEAPASSPQSKSSE